MLALISNHTPRAPPGRRDNAFDAAALALEDSEIALGGEGDALHDGAVHVPGVMTARQAEELATCASGPAEPSPLR